MLPQPKFRQMLITVYTMGKYCGFIFKRKGSPPIIMMNLLMMPSLLKKESAMPATTTLEMK